MHYRDRARATMQKVRERQVKAVVFVEVTVCDGGYLYSDYSFFMNYVHSNNSRWQAQQEIDRAKAIRESHQILIDHIMYYAKGNADYDTIQHAVRHWHIAKSEERISVYRLD